MTSSFEQVPDEAVEAAAREVYHTSGRNRVMPYSQAKESCESEARQILTAAAPFIAAQALNHAISYAEDQAMAGAYFPDWQNCADKIRAIPNPYRSGT